MSVNVPNKMPVPFANAGLKNTIPPTSDNVNGLAGYNQGFPPINMTAKTAGGIPPFGQDMNGILFAVTEALRFSQAGSTFVYDSAFATAIGGYRVGALVQRSDGNGFWLNLTDANVTDPESAGAAAAGWVPEFTYGIASITMTNANVTLTPAQYGRPIIVITGVLTANLNLIFPNIVGNWIVINSTTGAFSITCKTSSGSGILVAQGNNTQILCNATNILTVNVAIPMASETVDGIVRIATDAEAQAFAANKAIDGAKLNTAFKGGNQSLVAGSGFQKIPGGLIIQWGQFTSVSSISWPIAFPNQAISIVISLVTTSPTNWAGATSLTTTGATVSNSAITQRYIVIGN